MCDMKIQSGIARVTVRQLKCAETLWGYSVWGHTAKEWVAVCLDKWTVERLDRRVDTMMDERTHGSMDRCTNTI